MADDPAKTGITGALGMLRDPVEEAPAQVLKYGLGFLFQVAPRQAVVLCNVRSVGTGHWDFEEGTDAIVFDDLATIAQQKAVVVARSTQDTNPQTGQRRVAVHYPVGGGFVPLGARGADGAPHPHAGTGFGFAEVLCFDLNDQGYFTWDQPHTQQWCVYQFAYDGQRFRVVKAEMKPPEAPLKTTVGEWAIVSPGLSSAIPDGEDLLYAAVAHDGARSVSGVSRWRRPNGEWQPVAFYGLSDGSEPSLVRDVDGSLLYLVRGAGEQGTSVRVWRPRDDGPSVEQTSRLLVWEQVLDAPGLRSDAPVVLNQLADGTPYIAANEPGSFRARLCLWPLNAARTGVEPAIVARDCVARFGPAPAGTTWFADHATATTVRLADAQWHHLMAYRVMAFSTAGVGGETVTPHTGCYVEEILSKGRAIPAWRFE
jgi:hypothetical protein